MWLFTQCSMSASTACFFLGNFPAMKMEQTECSETSAYKIQTPGNYPEESIQQFSFIIIIIFFFLFFFFLPSSSPLQFLHLLLIFLLCLFLFIFHLPLLFLLSYTTSLISTHTCFRATVFCNTLNRYFPSM